MQFSNHIFNIYYKHLCKPRDWILISNVFISGGRGFYVNCWSKISHWVGFVPPHVTTHWFPQYFRVEAVWASCLASSPPGSTSLHVNSWLESLQRVCRPMYILIRITNFLCSIAVQMRPQKGDKLWKHWTYLRIFFMDRKKKSTSPSLQLLSSPNLMTIDKICFPGCSLQIQFSTTVEIEWKKVAFNLGKLHTAIHTSSKVCYTLTLQS